MRGLILRYFGWNEECVPRLPDSWWVQIQQEIIVENLLYEGKEENL